MKKASNRKHRLLMLLCNVVCIVALTVAFLIATACSRQNANPNDDTTGQQSETLADTTAADTETETEPDTETEPVTAKEKETEPPTTAHEHQYAATNTVKAACEANGSVTYTCACGSTYTEALWAAGHSYGDWVVTKAATQSEEGAQNRTCYVCGYIQYASIEKLPDDGLSEFGDTDLSVHRNDWHNYTAYKVLGDEGSCAVYDHRTSGDPPIVTHVGYLHLTVSFTDCKGNPQFIDLDFTEELRESYCGYSLILEDDKYWIRKTPTFH